MRKSDCSDNAGIHPLREQWRKWLPSLVGAILLMGLHRLARLADRYGGWFRDQHDLLSLVKFTAVIGSLILLYTLPLRIFPSPLCKDVSKMLRVASTFFFFAIGFKVGCRYVNACIGLPIYIEYLALFGTPVLVGTVVFVCKGRVIGYLIATCILTVVWILAGPYLAWCNSN